MDSSNTLKICVCEVVSFGQPTMVLTYYQVPKSYYENTVAYWDEHKGIIQYMSIPPTHGPHAYADFFTGPISYGL